MMDRVIPFIILLLSVSCGEKNTKESSSTASNNKTIRTIYDYTVTDIDGNPYELKQLEGKKVMIVNTASECGLTSQYKDLQEIYDLYKHKGLIIIGFPANNFKGQEPGSDTTIKEFCSREYAVTFPMMSKISVKGDDMAELYKFLTQASLNGKEDSEVKWNFQKYLIGADGKLEKVIPPTTSPKNPAIINWIIQK